ncbi:hypothetical protein CO051_06930 [Candidatus Roizmanbacteria bacterium CG_4_9_14_0_2_um_filter_39_13]|uniref:Uncharacterized protein n=1 Tax=Candidatus Roizmanbacteria bacterium CG_4_9_14_0_2_um_filter_39_13 TaxID=1974839 RepID=A0A2M8EWH3_9BACT|nr:MAG: hypothetical protein CO051_06930 [Candidatus Roizmanbacteria bacterium CG_4_9_14_0_2_um_filter_39_13]
MNEKKKDLKFSFLILLPLLIRSIAEINAYIPFLYMNVGGRSNPVFDIVKVTVAQVVIYALFFSYVYFSIYFARRQKNWARKLPYLTLLPLLVIIIMLFYEFFSETNKNAFWEGFFWIILLGGPIYLIVNIAMFLILKKRVDSAYKEGVTM